MNTKFNNILTDDRQELKDYIKGLAALSRKLKVVRRETPNRRMTPKEHEEIGRWILIYDDMWNIDRCLHYLSKILRCLYKKQAELRGKPEPEQNVRTEKKWGKDSFHYAWENCLNHYEVYYNHKEKMKQELEHKEHLQKLGYQDNGKQEITHSGKPGFVERVYPS